MWPFLFACSNSSAGILANCSPDYARASRDGSPYLDARSYRVNFRQCYGCGASMTKPPLPPSSNRPIQDPTLLQTPEQLRLQELADSDILSQPLPPPRLHDEISSRSLRARGLERPQLDALVEWITRDDAPAVEDKTDGRLTLCLDAEIGLEAETVDDGDQALDAVERGTGYGTVL